MRNTYASKFTPCLRRSDGDFGGLSRDLSED